MQNDHTQLPPSRAQQETEQATAPVSPDSPRVPYWPVSTRLDPDFFRWHPDYVSVD